MAYISQSHFKTIAVSGTYNPSVLTDHHIIACNTASAPVAGGAETYYASVDFKEAL